MSRRAIVLLLLIVVGLAAPGASAWAHAPAEVPLTEIESSAPATVELPSTAAWAAASRPMPSPWLAFAAAAVGLLCAGRRPRRVLVLGIVVVLAVFAFENGVHSVHHLGDHAAGAACAVASAAAQVAGTPVDVTLVPHIALPLLHAILPDWSSKVDTGFFAAHQGRAPPLAA